MSNSQIRKWDEDEREDNEARDGQPPALECVQRAGDIAVVPELWGARRRAENAPSMRYGGYATVCPTSLVRFFCVE